MATSFLPFSLVYGTETISPVELMVPTARTLQGQELETDVDMCAETRMVDLETMDEMRDITRERVRRYRQQMSSMYKQNVHERIFVEGQLILRVADYKRRNIVTPSKFAPN